MQKPENSHINQLLMTVALLIQSVFSSSYVAYAEDFAATDPPTAEQGSDTVVAMPAEVSPLAATMEWVYHKTADNNHPNGIEQRQLWFVNRARSNPHIEGNWLATETHGDVSGGRDYFGVDINKLQDEFSAISPMPPAAFDRRLYEAARVHSEDLIARDAQDHTNQFNRVDDAGFSWLSLGGVVFSYTNSGLHAHAAFNIDWGNEPDGMQTGRGHRMALMSDGKEYMNVGISSIYVSDSGKTVGPYVTTGNYAKANTNTADHFNTFIVGTVWIDTNSNGWYDDGEGYSGVIVMPSIGTYYAVTSDSGGYAIPITETGAATISFSGGSLPAAGSVDTTLSAISKLIDFIPSESLYYRDADQDTFGDPTVSVEALTQPDGYVSNNMDCDDTQGEVNPGAIEICDGVDNNCNFQIDEAGICGKGFWPLMLPAILNSDDNE